MKRTMILIGLLLLLGGCSHTKIVDTRPFTGAAGYAISGKIQRLDRERGVVTLQVEAERIWFAGEVVE